MESILAAIITGIFSIIAVYVAHRLNNKKISDRIASEPRSTNIDRVQKYSAQKHIYPKKYIEERNDEVIFITPEIKNWVLNKLLVVVSLFIITSGILLFFDYFINETGVNLAGLTMTIIFSFIWYKLFMWIKYHGY